MTTEPEAIPAEYAETAYDIARDIPSRVRTENRPFIDIPIECDFHSKPATPERARFVAALAKIKGEDQEWKLPRPKNFPNCF